MARLDLNSETCPTCKRRIKTSKPRSKVDADGIQRLADGREICRTKAAWRKRVDEKFEQNRRYWNEQAYWEGMYWQCAECGGKSSNRADFDVDHIIKRSLKLDDRLSNLQLLGNRNMCGCHEKKHDGFRKKVKDWMPNPVKREVRMPNPAKREREVKNQKT